MGDDFTPLQKTLDISFTKAYVLNIQYMCIYTKKKTLCFEIMV